MRCRSRKGRVSREGRARRALPARVVEVPAGREAAAVADPAVERDGTSTAGSAAAPRPAAVAGVDAGLDGGTAGGRWAARCDARDFLVTWILGLWTFAIQGRRPGCARERTRTRKGNVRPWMPWPSGSRSGFAEPRARRGAGQADEQRDRDERDQGGLDRQLRQDQQRN